MHFTAFIRFSFCGNCRSITLLNHLGKWFHAHKCRQWNAYYHPDNKQIWIPWDAARWHTHKIILERHSLNLQTIDPIVQFRSTCSPDNLIPVDTYDNGLRFSLPKLSRRPILHPPVTFDVTPTNLQELISQGSEYLRQSMSNLVEQTSPPQRASLNWIDHPLRLQ
jgi:hypothetical protein